MLCLQGGSRDKDTTSSIWALDWDWDRLLLKNETSVSQKPYVQAPWWNKMSGFALPSPALKRKGNLLYSCCLGPLCTVNLVWSYNTVATYSSTDVLDLQSRDLLRGGHLNCSVSNIMHFSLCVRFGKKILESMFNLVNLNRFRKSRKRFWLSNFFLYFNFSSKAATII